MVLLSTVSDIIASKNKKKRSVQWSMVSSHDNVVVNSRCLSQTAIIRVHPGAASLNLMERFRFPLTQLYTVVNGRNERGPFSYRRFFTCFTFVL